MNGMIIERTEAEEQFLFAKHLNYLLELLILATDFWVFLKIVCHFGRHWFQFGDNE